MVSLILAHILSILVVGGLRFGPEAVLAGAGRGPWIVALSTASVGLAVALARDTRRGRAPWSRPGRILLWLVFPGTAALHWGLGRTEVTAGGDLPGIALVLGLVLGLLARRHDEWADRERRGQAWRIAARWVLGPTALVAAVGIAFGDGLHGSSIALLTYPLYALGQLAAALVLPWTQWRRDGLRSGRVVLAIATLFALVHWPNPFAAVTTFLGMLLWASAWNAGSALLPLALSMGIMATVVNRTMPVELTGHLRVGANAVLKSRELERERWLDREVGRISAEAGPLDAGGLRPWLARALPLATGAPVDPGLISGTADVLERLHRESMLRWVFDSAEFRARHRVTARLEPTELRFFESTFVPFHPAHAPYTNLAARGAGLDHGEFVDLVYAELLGRTPAQTEYRHWPLPLTVGTRMEFLRRVLEGGGIGGPDLRRWHEPEDPELRRRLRETRAATQR